MNNEVKNEKLPPRRLYQEFCDFIEGFKTVHLATISQQNQPEASYAPVLQQEGRYYIYISELAQHTQNLLATSKASLLFIESEEKAENLFARKRATLQSRAQNIARNSEQWQKIMHAFADSHGEMITMLKELKDFHLFELTPESAGFVKGFAQAFSLEGDDLSKVRLRNDRGHGQSQVEAEQPVS